MIPSFAPLCPVALGCDLGHALRRAVIGLGLVAMLAPGPAGAGGSVAIQDWTAAARGPVLAELDFTSQMVLTEQGRTAFVLPLLAVPQDGSPGAAGLVMGGLVTPGVTTLDDERLDALLAAPVRIGEHGPVVLLELSTVPDPSWQAAFAAALADEGRRLAPGAPMLVATTAGGTWTERGMPVLAAVAAVLALLVMTLTMRALSRPAPRRSAAGVHHRLAPYVPAMATGENGTDALRRVLTAEVTRATDLPVYRPGAAPAPTPTLAPLPVPLADAAPAPVVPPRSGPRTDAFPDLPPEAYPGRRRTGGRAARRMLDPGASLVATAHFGPEPAKERRLSRRALNRLESDPFVQRLAKLT